MGDVASPTYPTYQPQQNQGLLAGDPTKVIGIINALNQNKLFQAQYPALSQQPQAALDGQNIANATHQLEQDDKTTQILAHQFAILPDDATKEQIYNRKAEIRAVFPNIPAAKINSFADDTLLHNPNGIKHGLDTLRTMGISPETMVSRVEGPPTSSGQPTKQPLTTAIRAGAQPTGLSPKETATQQQTGSGAGSAINDARLRNVNYPQEVFGLEQAIPALEKLGKTGTGPGTEELNHVKSFLQSAGIPGLDVDKIKNFDEAQKYLTDYARQNGDSGTNDKLAASFKANPSVGISNAAATQVAKSALTLRRMQQARTIAFENSGKSDEDYPKEAGKWNREHDPRAYGFDLMSPEQRKATLESLPAGKREIFMMDVQDALKNGIIKSPK